MVEKLYGVRHGYGTQFAGMTIDETFVAPSRGLMRDLSTLPLGTSVGIEIFPEVWQPFEVQGEINTITEANDFYWGRIKRLCERRGLDIVYLGDFETYKKYLEKELELRRLVHIALKYESKNEEVPKEVMRRMYAMQVEAEHILIFEREEKLFDRIQETQPAVVILGRGHTDPLLLDSQPLKSRGISIGEYRAEEVFTPPSNWIPEESYYRTDLVYPLEPDEKILLERDLAKRRYRALTTGRVMEDRTPDYIGTWDTQVPARGLFEVYFNDDGRTGTIEDCLGTATFFGNIPGKTASFVKRYIPEKSSGEIVPGDVIYVVDSVGKVKTGEYRSPDVRGIFILKKFDGTPYPVSS